LQLLDRSGAAYFRSGYPSEMVRDGGISNLLFCDVGRNF
jgi:hypothetical protein